MHTDAADLEHASIFDDADPGVNIGGWGNPAADYAVETGAFAGFQLEYPFPHKLRRQFTLYPFVNHTTKFHVIPEQIVNVTLTEATLKGLIGGHKGNFTEFQRYLEALQVMKI